MKQFISLIVTSFFLLFGFAFAHSDLENSTPTNGTVLNEATKEILLTFENDIEADLVSSKFIRSLRKSLT